jgi:type I restriction enzyme M protein
MAEIIEPQQGNSVADWAAGSGGLLLQCRNYVKRYGGDPNRLLLYAQESNVATYNISRINRILHGVPSWNHRQRDSIRTPRLLDERTENCLTAYSRLARTKSDAGVQPALKKLCRFVLPGHFETQRTPLAVVRDFG